MNQQLEAQTETALHARIAALEAELAEARHRQAATLDELQTRERELEARSAELAESLEYQSVTSGVLEVIARATGQLERVLEAVANSAAAVCGATNARIFQLRGDQLIRVARSGELPNVETRGVSPHLPLTRGSVAGRSVLERRTIHVADLAAETATEYPDAALIQKEVGHRSIVATPLIRDGIPLGAINVLRTEVRPFTERQIAALETFADQAVIAIENARLLDELQTRQKELEISLNQQTATADVLKSISRSTFELQPVLDTLVNSAAKLCGADMALIRQRIGGGFPITATTGLSTEQLSIYETYSSRPGPGSVFGRAILAKSAQMHEDVLTDPQPDRVGAAQAVGFRSILVVPLLREGCVVGAFSLMRKTPGPFSKSEIDLVETFADQAVIAIANVGLFEEVQARTKALTESLEYQTATSEVLRIISRSPTDVQPVLDAIVATASRLCRADYALAFRLHGELYQVVAASNADAAFIKYVSENSKIKRGRESLVGRTALECRTIHLPDCLADPDYARQQTQKAGKYRTMLGVPLMREGIAIGVLSLVRTQVEPFSDREIDLVRTFADQAVIAIENARLFEAEQTRTRELAQSLEYQTAISEVLGVISRSPDNLQPVLDSIATTAVKLCEPSQSIILLEREGALHRVASHNYDYTETGEGRLRKGPIDRSWTAGRAVVDGKAVHIPDLLAAADEFPLGYEIARREGHRTVLGIPLLRRGQAIGCLFLRRTQVQPFSDQQIALLQTFAEQAVIAINNVSLFEEVQARTKELQESLEYQTAISDVLGVISRSPNELQPVLDSIVTTATELCHADHAHVRMLRGGRYHVAASTVAKASAIQQAERENPIAPGRDSVTGRAIAELRTVHVHDATADPEHTYFQRIGGVTGRTILAVPIVHTGTAIGTITLFRNAVAPFTERQIKQITTFADQALIAIQNTRLFEQVQERTRELTESLEYQTATSEVLSVISRSPDKLQPVLDAIVRTAERLCDADRAQIWRLQGDRIALVAHVDSDATLVEFFEREPTRRVSDTIHARSITERSTIHIADALNDPEASGYEHVRVGQVRSVLSVPLMRDGNAIGVISLVRRQVRPFTQRQINLVTTFANQAVIAINNVGLFEEVQARTKELTESLEYQTATSEVLGVISRSPNELQPVLDAIAATAERLCEGDRAQIFLERDGHYALAAHSDTTPEIVSHFLANPIRPGRETATARAAQEGHTIHVPDVTADPEYDPSSFHTLLGGSRLVVPLRRIGRTMGLIAIPRRVAKPFTDRQIALVTTFADQAIIAMSNARLFEEVQARTKELTESLEYQTATSEVLGVIARAPGEVQPVLDAIVTTGARLCQAEYAILFNVVGEQCPVAASNNTDAAFVRYLVENPVPLIHGSTTGRAALERRTVHVADVLAESGYARRDSQKVGRQRTVLSVPLLRDGLPIGVITMMRSEVRPYADRQIALVETFADQAVIAIENARLLDELQTRQRELEARGKELTESLEYQTATSEVLGVISRSPNELQPVFEAIVHTALRLCEADRATLMRLDGDHYKLAARTGVAADQLEDLLRAHPIPADHPGAIVCRVAAGRRPLQVDDVRADPTITLLKGLEGDPRRTILGVPLLRGETAIGVIMLSRHVVRPFTERQIALVTTFADQAVIAINNVGLFEEVQARTKDLTESLEYQTAIAEVLGVISRSPDTLQPVLDAIAAIAARLCQTDFTYIFRLDGGHLRLAAQHAGNADHARYVANHPHNLDRGSLAGRVMIDRKTIHLPDVLADHEFTRWESQRLGGQRSLLGVPLFRHGDPIGVITLARKEVQPFTEREIDLITTFANQAVIAINNVGLFEEVQARTKELSESLEYQTATSEVLSVISRSPDKLRPVLDEIVVTSARLCGAEFSMLFRVEGDVLPLVANNESNAAFVRYCLDHPVPLTRGSNSGRAAVDGRTIHTHDVHADPENTRVEAYQLGGQRTVLSVPLLRDGHAIGVITLMRSAVQPFTDRQIDLVETFADQAVIAINNVGLFEEVQARTRDLQEALGQQTATADVLKAISRSALDLQRVLDTLAESAALLCDAFNAAIFRMDGKLLRLAASHGPMPFEGRVGEYTIPLVRERVTGRATIEQRAIHVADMQAEPSEYPGTRDRAISHGFHTTLAVPLLRGGEALGAILIRRSDIRLFSDRQIELLQTFADQAVIAIENTRLFEEVQTRTKELARSVEELKSLGEVGQAVSSTLDMSTVLQTILENATRMAFASGGTIYVYDREHQQFRLEAGFNMSEEHMARVKAQPIRLGEPVVGEAGRRREAVQVEDLQAADLQTPLLQILLRAGVRAILAVPLLHQGEVIGALVVRRNYPGRFAPDTVRLLEAFAAQSAIAVNNARLFAEIQEKGHQLEIASQHKSQFLANMSHELRTPLNAILGYAELMADGAFGEIAGEQRETVERIERNGKHLLGLINDVLDLSKIEAGEMALAIEEYSLASLVRTAIVATEPLARQKGLALDALIAEGMPVGLGDTRRLAQVLLNLIGNAIKFTDRGAVTIAAASENGEFRIDVRDTGPGIAAVDLDRIFGKFQQVDNTSTRKKGGTGLGLAIAREFVEMHGGTITVGSVLGEGAVFTILLPVDARTGHARSH